MEPNINKQLDARGEVCPWPVMLTMKEIHTMPSGEVLEVLIDHTPSLTNIPEAAKREGHEIVSTEKLEQGVYRILIKTNKLA